MMEDQDYQPEQVNVEFPKTADGKMAIRPRAHYWRLIGRFVALVLGALALVIAVSAYTQYREAAVRSQELLSTPNE